MPNFALEPEEQPRFANPRDQVLHVIGKSALVKSGGDTEAITGLFAQVSVTPADLREVSIVFGHEITEAGLQDIKILLGHYVVQENCEHEVSVYEYETERQAKMTVQALDDIYQYYAIDQLGF